MKRLITDNTGGKGDLDTDAVQRAVLQYRNTPDPDTKISPAMCVFGRMIRDFIPVIPGKYLPTTPGATRYVPAKTHSAKGTSRHTSTGANTPGVCPHWQWGTMSASRTKLDNTRTNGTAPARSWKSNSMTNTKSKSMDPVA